MHISPERLFKTVHGWLGVLILPWILVIGLTGLYLNHWKAVDRVLTGPAFNESQFDDWAAPKEQDAADVIVLASTLWPEQGVPEVERTTYHGRDAWRVSYNRASLIVDVETGHYWVKTGFTRKTFTPDGTLLHTKVYWGSLFKTIHEYGWFNSRLGTWLADMTASAMVLFGLTGIYLFTAPRLRRRKNRVARLRAQRRNAPTGNLAAPKPLPGDPLIKP